MAIVYIYYIESDRVGERLVMAIGVLCAMTGIIFLYPYGGPLPPLKSINETASDFDTISSWKSTESELPVCYNASLALTDGKFLTICIPI